MGDNSSFLETLGARPGGSTFSAPNFVVLAIHALGLALEKRLVLGFKAKRQPKAAFYFLDDFYIDIHKLVHLYMGRK